MSGRARVIVPALLAVVAVIAGTMLGGGIRIGDAPPPSSTLAANATATGGAPTIEPFICQYGT